MGEARARISALGGWDEDRYQRPQTPPEETPRVHEGPSRPWSVTRRRNSSSADERRDSSSPEWPRYRWQAHRRNNSAPDQHAPEAGPSTAPLVSSEPRRLDGKAAYRLLLARARRVVRSSSTDSDQGSSERARLRRDTRLPDTPPDVPTKTTKTVSSDGEIVPVLFHTAQSYQPRVRMNLRGLFKAESDTDSYETISTPPPRPPGRAALRGEDSEDEDDVPLALRNVLRRAMKSMSVAAGSDSDEPVLPSVLLPRPGSPPGSPPAVRVRLRSKTSIISPRLEPARPLPPDEVARLPLDEAPAPAASSTLDASPPSDEQLPAIPCAL
ncbi:hypothetical protein Q8F55_007883 [Vanrija albida]|uniref:Uncharacterized protein n=1 Tax=Vanrija albida TaxID=181172 RepID=A0ABR3PUS0_9TREE